MIWSYVIICYLSLFVYGLCDNIRGPLFPDILQFFSVQNQVGSLLFAVSSFFGFLVSWNSALVFRIVDRVQSVYLGLGFLGLFFIIMSHVERFPLFLLACAGFGMGIGLLSVSQNALAAAGSSPKYMSRVMSGLHSMYGVSSFLAPLIVNLVLAKGGGWRTCLLVSGMSCLTLALVGWLAVPRERTQMHPEIGSREKIGRSLSHYLISFSFAFYVAAEILISSRLAMYLRTEKVFSANLANSFVSYFFAFLLLGRVLYTLLPMQLNLPRQLSLSLFLSFCFVVLGLYWNPWFLSLTGLSMAPYFPLGMAYITQMFSNSVKSVMGLAMAVQSIALVAMHLLVGTLTDIYGIQLAMNLGLAFLLLSLILLRIFIRRNAKGVVT